MMEIDMKMFHQTFFEEGADLLADFESGLLILEDSPEDQDVLGKIFRCAHSIKGGAATFGFTDVAQFTHSLETLLDLLRNGKIYANRDLVQLLLESLDQLKALMMVAQGSEPDAPDSAPLLARMDVIIGAADDGETDESSSTLWRIRIKFQPGANVMTKDVDPFFLMSQAMTAGTAVYVDCDSSRLPDLSDLDPKCCYLGWTAELLSSTPASEFEEIFEAACEGSELDIAGVDAFDADGWGDEPASSASSTDSADTNPSAAAEPAVAGNTQPSLTAMAAPKRAAAGGSSGEAQTLRVSTVKVDELMNLVGELVINQSMLNSSIQDFDMEKLPRLEEAVAAMERASRELQERVMAVRMLPIKSAFARFPRLVRDLATSCGKEIELRTSGEETELDKTVIESITDPLTHLIRNSVDHGLELPEDRRAAGKSLTGTINLDAFQEGGNIVIEVSDDGKGLDKDRIYKKALAQSLISDSDPMPSDDTIYNYIFHAGFSTAEKVTDLSGRGVGMDIVKKAIHGLHGSIAVSTVPGEGTKFRVRLPLTMAILEGLSVLVGNEVYILPLTSIVESIRPTAEEVRTIAGAGEIVVVRGEVLALMRLYQLFGAAPIVTDPSRATLVIVENDGRKAALLVDELIGQNQVVIKSMETNYQKVEGIAGATIMGDGRVALILDVPSLIRGAVGSEGIYSAAA